MTTICRAVVALGAFLAVLPALRAGDVEEREFVTLLDGRRVGDYRLKVTAQDDGVVVVSGQGQMQLTHPAGVTKYHYRGSEVWKDGRLLRLESTSGDETKQTSVRAVAEADGVRVTVGGRDRVLPNPLWVTTYWRLPPEEVRSRELTLLDADNGRDLRVRLERVGTGQVILNGRPESCTKYQVSGGVGVELWYDGQDRLVRQEWGQDGRRVVLELTQVRH